MFFADSSAARWRGVNRSEPRWPSWCPSTFGWASPASRRAQQARLRFSPARTLPRSSGATSPRIPRCRCAGSWRRPGCSPSFAEEAGRHLAAVAAEHAFTLFEFFQTDLAGHGRLGDGIGIVERFDRFLGATLEATDLEETLVLLTSDHGNLEDERTDGHTLNPVPAVLVGAGRETLGPRLRAITDLAPACLDVLGAGRAVS